MLLYRPVHQFDWGCPFGSFEGGFDGLRMLCCSVFWISSFGFLVMSTNVPFPYDISWRLRFTHVPSLHIVGWQINKMVLVFRFALIIHACVVILESHLNGYQYYTINSTLLLPHTAWCTTGLSTAVPRGRLVVVGERAH